VSSRLSLGKVICQEISCPLYSLPFFGFCGHSDSLPLTFCFVYFVPSERSSLRPFVSFPQRLHPIISHAPLTRLFRITSSHVPLSTVDSFIPPFPSRTISRRPSFAALHPSSGLFYHSSTTEFCSQHSSVPSPTWFESSPHLPSLSTVLLVWSRSPGFPFPYA